MVLQRKKCSCTGVFSTPRKNTSFGTSWGVLQGSLWSSFDSDVGPGELFGRPFGSPCVDRSLFLVAGTIVSSAPRKNTCLGAFLGLFLESFWSSLDSDVGPWALNKFAKTQNMCKDIYAHIFKSPNNTCCRLRFWNLFGATWSNSSRVTLLTVKSIAFDIKSIEFHTK